MPRNEIEPLLTVDEVAAILRLEPKTIRNRVSQGDFHIPRVEGLGRTLRFRRADVERVIGARDEAEKVPA